MHLELARRRVMEHQAVLAVEKVSRIAIVAHQVACDRHVDRVCTRVSVCAEDRLRRHGVAWVFHVEVYVCWPCRRVLGPWSLQGDLKRLDLLLLGAESGRGQVTEDAEIMLSHRPRGVVVIGDDVVGRAHCLPEYHQIRGVLGSARAAN